MFNDPRREAPGQGRSQTGIQDEMSHLYEGS
jgi:hypothetical protein